jgi:hypothetical protein
MIKAKKKAKSLNEDTRMKVAERGYKTRIVSKEEEDRIYAGRRYKDYK